MGLWSSQFYMRLRQNKHLASVNLVQRMSQYILRLLFLTSWGTSSKHLPFQVLLHTKLTSVLGQPHANLCKRAVAHVSPWLFYCTFLYHTGFEVELIHPHIKEGTYYTVGLYISMGLNAEDFPFSS